MKRIVIIGFMIALFMFLSKLAGAQPDFEKSVQEHGLTLFGDVEKANVYYYLPGDLHIASAADGSPDFKFIMMRYAGSALYNEDENVRYRNLLTMRIQMKRISDDSLRRVKGKLSAHGRTVLLKPVPLSMIDARIIFTPVGAPDSSAIVKEGSLSADGGAGYSTSGSYWQERYFTIHLDNHSANLLVDAFKNDYTALSFAYAFYAKGKKHSSFLDVGAPPQVAGRLRELFAEARPDSGNIGQCVVKSNAFTLYIDTSKHPSLIQKIDINDGVPPGYAVLNVRNYDFANNLRDDLYEKSIDLEATGAGGNKVTTSVSFRHSAPEVTSMHFKFRYAVRLDEPYRYRIRELLKDGREVISEWKVISMWSALLDVTTPKY